MRAFQRRPCPQYWAEADREWRARAPEFGTGDPLGWKRRPQLSEEPNTLRVLFHRDVRAATESAWCAYCDGIMGETSSWTIDHFRPQRDFPELTLDWENLFPACERCNTNKGSYWSESMMLVRPDHEPVEEWVVVEPTGELSPNPALDEKTRQRVSTTMDVLGLNERPRVQARKRALVYANQVFDRHHMDDIEALQEGPYRFVTQRVMDARRPMEG